MEKNMKGKTELITGAGSGIGRSIDIASGEQGAMVVSDYIRKRGGRDHKHH